MLRAAEFSLIICISFIIKILYTCLYLLKCSFLIADHGFLLYLNWEKDFKKTNIRLIALSNESWRNVSFGLQVSCLFHARKQTPIINFINKTQHTFLIDRIKHFTIYYLLSLHFSTLLHFIKSHLSSLSSILA